MTTVLVLGDLAAVPADLMSALENARCSTSAWAAAGRPEPDAIIVTDPEQMADLHYARALPDVPTAVLVRRATLDALVHHYLPFTDAVALVEVDYLTADAARDVVARLAGRRERLPNAPTTGDVAIAGTDPSGGEPRREPALSFASPAMQSFLAELRSAVRVMRREMPAIPWHPADALPSRIERGADNRWTLDPKHAGSFYNLRDLFFAPEDERSRSAFRTGLVEDPDVDRFGKPPHLLLLGDSGTGKTMIARFVRDLIEHDLGEPFLDAFLAAPEHKREQPPAPRMPFVEINCGGMTVENFDHILHGAVPGVFSDAVAVGELVRGAYGVVFLDELGDLTLDVQKRLLTYLEDRRVRPVGMPDFPSFSRIVAATNRDLGAMVRAGEFRHDLLARFARRIRIPALAERGASEIARLALYAAQDPLANPPTTPGSAEPGVTHVSAAAMGVLVGHSYRDGNYRELETVVHRAVSSALRRGSRVIEAADVSVAEPDFVQETDRLVVQLAPDATVPGAPVEVAHRADLERMASTRQRPLLRGADGTLHLPDGAIVYTWRAPR